LNRTPDLGKYSANDDTLEASNKAFRSQVFGGSVFRPIGKKDSKLIRRENKLEEDIRKYQVNYLYGGGFYELANVRETPPPMFENELANKVFELGNALYNAWGGDDKEEEEETPENDVVFWDIKMLVDSIQETDDLKKLRYMNEQPKGYEKTVELEDVLPLLTGYGRIIKYKVLNEEEKFTGNNCELLYIVEGKFVEGQMDGYCRLIDCTAEEVHVGFFKNDLPMGKYQKFTLDDEVAEEGIKEEEELVKEVEIKNYLTRDLTNANKA